MKNIDQLPIGEITEILPNGRYRLQMEDGAELIAYRAGKLKKNNIFLLIGDKVRVVLDPYKGTDTNRIVWRSKD